MSWNKGNNCNNMHGATIRNLIFYLLVFIDRYRNILQKNADKFSLFIKLLAPQ